LWSLPASRFQPGSPASRAAISVSPSLAGRATRYPAAGAPMMAERWMSS
jgi:hypothetical protein